MTERLACPLVRPSDHGRVPAPDKAAFVALTRRWWAVAFAWVATILSFGAALAQVWAPRWATQWGIVSAGLAAYLLATLRGHLAENRRASDGPLLPNFGPGNALSIQRGLATVLVGGFLFAPRPPGAWAWLPVGLYTLAALADLFDGYLARRADHTTLLGAWLDMELDSLGVLLVTVLAVSYGQLPIWYMPVALGRQLFVLGIRWRERGRRPVHPLPQSAHRRLFAGVQMGFVSVSLWPIIPANVVTLVGVVVAIPTALGFVRDWLVVSGRVDASDPSYLRLQRRLVVLARDLLPLVLRLLVPIGLLGFLLAGEVQFSQPIAWAGILLAGAVVSGFAGRAAALLFLIPLGAEILADGLLWPSSIALVAAVAIILLGTGPLSVWRPEERYLFARPGTSGFGEA